MCPVLRLHVNIVAASQDLGLGNVAIAARGGARGLSHHPPILIDKLEVVAAQQMGDRRQLRTVSLRVFVELKERDGEELHVLGDAEDLCSK